MRLWCVPGKVPCRRLPARESSIGALIGCLLLASAASCYVDNTTDWSPASPRERVPEPPPEPEPYASRVEQLPPEWSEEEKVVGLLMSYCGDCHGPNRCGPHQSCAGMDYIDNLSTLITEGQIIPGAPEVSPIVSTMADGWMPPGNNPDVPPELIERVSAFIEGLCPSDLPECEVEAGTGE